MLITEQDTAHYVSLRELNQQSGRVMARVRDSQQEVIVTERGKPIATIVPIQAEVSPLARLIAEGNALPASQSISSIDFNSLVITTQSNRSLDGVIQKDRDDRL